MLSEMSSYENLATKNALETLETLKGYKMFVTRNSQSDYRASYPAEILQCSTFGAHLHALQLSWGGAPLLLGWAWGCRSLPRLWCYGWHSIQQFCSSEAWDQWCAWSAELSESKTSRPSLRSKTTLPMGILTNRPSIFKILTQLTFPLTLPQKAPGNWCD